jgi:hypothetical protein
MRETTKTLSNIVCLQAEIWNGDVPYTKQEC